MRGPYFIALSWISGAAPPRPRIVSTFLRTPSRVSQRLYHRAMGAGLHRFDRGGLIGFVGHDENANAGKSCADLADQARPAGLQKRDAEQHDVGLQPVHALGIGFLGCCQLVGLDFVMQHELERGAGDLVLVDHEYAPLVDGLGCLDTDLHLTFSSNCLLRRDSNFRSVSPSRKSRCIRTASTAIRVRFLTVAVPL
jgi:hypothetical protein